MLRKLTSFALFVFLAAHASAATRYLVALKHPLRTGRIAVLHNDTDLTEHRVRQFDNLATFAADLTPEEVADLQKSPDVRYVEKVVERNLLENDSANVERTASDLSKYATQQIPWGIAAIHAPELWDLAKNTTPVNVVVLDTGIDSTHPDLAANYMGGYNALAPDATAMDDNGHGTHVAGTIAALNNGIGVVGVAPNTHLWAVKVLDNLGKGTTEYEIAGLNWVLSQSKSLGGKWIVSLSLGGPDGSATDSDAFQKIYDAGILTVAAAGNTGLGSLDYPGAYPTVIAAGAVDQTLTRPNFSSYGANMGLAAPGVTVLSTTRVGSIPIADVEIDGNVTLSASPLKGSPTRDVVSSYVFCNLGRPEDFPPSVAGHIALIERGCGTGALDGCDLTFNEKVKNAMTAGATAAVIYNFKGGDNDISRWTLVRLDCVNTDCTDYKPDLDYPWILAVGVTYEDGQKILNTKSLAASYRAESYKTLSGTSMATPHVSGAAALIWSIASNATAHEVRNALFAGAADAGATGYDPYYGFGVVNALTSAKLLTPALFGLPAAPQPPKRRPN